MIITRKAYGNPTNTTLITHMLKGNRLELFFSYDTLVAFSLNGNLSVRKNEWGVTTGKHLNLIDNGNKKERLEYSAFSAALSDAYAGFFNELK